MIKEKAMSALNSSLYLYYMNQRGRGNLFQIGVSLKWARKWGAYFQGGASKQHLGFACP